MDKLTKQQVLDAIIRKVNEAYSDPTNDFERLCDIFEACHGYDIDKNIEYLPSLDVFNVWEETNLN